MNTTNPQIDDRGRSGRLQRSRTARATGAVALLAAGGLAVSVIGDGTAQAVPSDTAGVGLAGQPGGIRVIIRTAEGKTLSGDDGRGTYLASYLTWGARVPITAGKPAGRPVLSNLVFRHDVGPGSLPLLTTMGKGTQLASVTVSLVKKDAEGRTRVYYSYGLNDAFLQSVQNYSPDSHSATEGGRVPPQEEVVLTYSDIVVGDEGGGTWSSGQG